MAARSRCATQRSRWMAAGADELWVMGNDGAMGGRKAGCRKAWGKRRKEPGLIIVCFGEVFEWSVLEKSRNNQTIILDMW